MKQKIEVTHFCRRPAPGFFSLERIYADVRAYISTDIDIQLVENPYASRGVVRRILNAWIARRYRRHINHILGDVHYLAIFFRRRGTLITVADCVLLETTSGLRRWAIWWLWYWWPLRRAEHVVTISAFSKAALMRWVRFPEERITVIPPTLGDSFVQASARPHGEWRELLMLGGAPNKNIARVAEALKGLHLRLTLIGEISDEDRAALTLHEIDHAIHAGLGDEAIVKAYRECDILLFPSTYEGFGMPIIEAQATGRPVVTSKLEPMIDTAGGAAIFVDPLDVGSIRAGVKRLLDNEKESADLIDAGLRNAEMFRAPAISAAYAELYRFIADDSGASGSKSA